MRKVRKESRRKYLR